MTLADAAILVPLYAAAVVGVINAVGAHWGRKAQKKDADDAKAAVLVEAETVKTAIDKRAGVIDSQLRTIHEATNGGLSALKGELGNANAEIKRLRTLLDRRTALLLDDRLPSGERRKKR